MPAASARSRADANFGKTWKSSRAGAGIPYIVGPAASERFDVPQFGACSHRTARQPGPIGERICATHTAGGIGRRGQFCDQRRALRSRQSKRAQRPQRHRQRVEHTAAWQKLAAAASCLRIRRIATFTRDSAPVRRRGKFYVRRSLAIFWSSSQSKFWSTSRPQGTRP
jgi:hypothetical protein